jgi:hypothetical protein
MNAEMLCYIERASEMHMQFHTFAVFDGCCCTTSTALHPALRLHNCCTRYNFRVLHKVTLLATHPWADTSTAVCNKTCLPAGCQHKIAPMQTGEHVPNLSTRASCQAMQPNHQAVAIKQQARCNTAVSAEVACCDTITQSAPHNQGLGSTLLEFPAYWHC